MSETIKRIIVQLQFNCTEGKMGDIVAMREDMIKAYGPDYVKEIKEKEILEKFEDDKVVLQYSQKIFDDAIKFAEKNGVSVPKNINVLRFLDRIEAIKENLKNKEESKNPVSKKEILELQKKVLEDRKNLDEDIEAFEEIKKAHAEDKLNLETLKKDFAEEVELFESKKEEKTPKK